jgi:uncharacterized protein YcsI (UPF0317 family)
MVVSMRPVPEALVQKAVDATSPHVLAHGGPIHCGDPAALGIAVRFRRESVAYNRAMVCIAKQSFTPTL